MTFGLFGSNFNFNPLNLFLFSKSLEIKLCSFTQTTTTKTTQIEGLTLESSALPIPSRNTSFKKRKPVIFDEKFYPKSQNLSECICDADTFIGSQNPWVLVGVGAGLIVAIALSVTACCW